MARGQNSKFRFLEVCFVDHRIYKPSYIDIGPAVSEPEGFENVDTSWRDGRTFNRFYNSSEAR